MSPPAGPDSSRRERELAFRTGLVLEAAEDVFARRGFQAASVEEIAARAEVAIATLYKMFGSKEELFAAIVSYRQDRFVAEIEAQVSAAADPLAQLDRLIEGTFRYFDRHNAAFRIYMSSTHGFPWQVRSSMGDRVFAKYQDFVAYVGRLLEAGMHAGAWPKTDPMRLAGAVLGLLNASLTLWQSSEKPAAVEAEIAAALEFVRRVVGVESGGKAPRARTKGGRRR